jgi:hypothetical protein
VTSSLPTKPVGKVRLREAPTRAREGGAMGDRVCANCNGSMEGKRVDAVYCSRTCKREAYRARRLETGEPDGHYVTLRQWQERSSRRIGVAKRAGEAAGDLQPIA